MKRILYLFLILFSLNAAAQKKEIVQIKEYLKKGTNIDKAASLSQKLLTDTNNRKNLAIWELLEEAQLKQYQKANEELYLKQKHDTTNFFKLTKQLFETHRTADSISRCVETKSKTIHRFLNKSAETLNGYRINLYNGGIYYIYKNDYKTAYNFFDAYINCSNIVTMQRYNYSETDSLLPIAAYWTVYCGYKNRDTRQTLHHAYTALKDKSHYLLMLQFLSETYKSENDTARYLQTLKDGFSYNPTFPYFFPRLFKYYTDREDWIGATELTHEALRYDSLETRFLFAKSTIYLYTEKYDDCIFLVDSLIARNDTLSAIYLNAGLAYYYKALRLETKPNKTKADKQKVLHYYEKALPYLETYRSKNPNRTNRWGLPLYTIYLNLNKGDEFDEVSSILRHLQDANENR